MKIRGKREVALVASGIVLGATLAAPAATATLTAQQSNQKIFVDGKPVQIEAYSINGNNYAKIRDLGKAAGFNVSYDAATNTVHISTDGPYAEETPAQSSRVVTLPTDGSKYVPKGRGQTLLRPTRRRPVRPQPLRGAPHGLHHLQRHR